MPAEVTLVESAGAVMADELEKLRGRIIRNLQSEGVNASGRTARSLRVEVTSEAGRLYGRAPFAALETGRSGGKVPRGFYGIIRQWVLDKKDPHFFYVIFSKKLS